MRLPRRSSLSARWLVLALALLVTVSAAPPPAGWPPVVIALDPTGTNRGLALAYSPDGRLLAVGTATGLALYDAQTQAELRFIPSDSWVRSLAFAPDRQTLAAGYYGPDVRLWRVADGSLLRTLTGHTSWVRSLVFTPDGGTLITASDDQTVRWWRVADGAPLRTLADGMTGVRVVALSPDGQTLAAGGAGPVHFRLVPQPDLQRLAWGAGQINVPAGTTFTGTDLRLTLDAGWLWGQGAGGAPVVIEAAGVTLTISDGPFALVSRPGQPAWLYLLGGRAEAHRVGQPVPLTLLAAGTMLALTPAGALTAVPLDAVVIAALPPTSAAPAPVWAPTLAAQINNRLALAGITAAQVVTFVTSMGVLIALFGIPIVRLSWWLRNRKRPGRLAHV